VSHPYESFFRLTSRLLQDLRWSISACSALNLSLALTNALPRRFNPQSFLRLPAFFAPNPTPQILSYSKGIGVSILSGIFGNRMFLQLFRHCIYDILKTCWNRWQNIPRAVAHCYNRDQYSKKSGLTIGLASTISLSPVPNNFALKLVPSSFPSPSSSPYLNLK
jgi:hypothetical protein